MGPEFTRPWLLLLLPAAAALVWWGWLAPARRYRAAAAALRPGRAGRARAYTADLTGRYRATSQHKAAVALRAAMLGLLILALAGTAWRFTARRQATVFAVDVSASVGGRETAVSDFLRQATAAAGPDDEAAVVAVGRSAMVDAPLGPRLAPGPVTSDPGKDYTDLAGGLQLAGSLLPDYVRRRVVLITDGHENIGDAVAQARALAAQGIRVDVVPVEGAHGPEVMVADVQTPATAFSGELVPVTAAVRATTSTTATVRLYAGNAQVAQQQVSLQPGLNQVSFKVPAGDRGFQTYRVEVESPADTRPENNSGAAVTRVAGKPAVLLVRQNPDDAAALRAALAAQGARVEERDPVSLPGSAEELRTYAAVVLVDVPAYALREQTMAQLESYVKDFGGGLMMVGGEESFGMGGYQGTPIERAMPVYMDIKGRGEIPSLGLILVMDKSGSMGLQPRYGDPVKLEIAKEAAMRTLDVLSDQDIFGVIAFDAAAGWVVEPTPVDNKAAMQAAIGRIYPGGGTNIYPGLELAYAGLRGAMVKTKHVILLTDGVSAYGGNYERMTQLMREAGITLSTVAVGNDADVALLQQLARWGRGRFYFTESGETIPTIFAKETVLVTRSYVEERSFTPVAAAASPLLRGLNSVPTLQGYVVTRPKEAAEVALASPEQDPVLAHWQYGLGRAVAWTPDLTGRWARPWLGTPELQQLLNNAFAWLMRPEAQGDLQVSVQTGPGTVSLHVDAPPESGARPAAAQVTDPSLGTRTVDLQAVAPGQYTADLDVHTPGAYLVQVQQTGADSSVQQTGAGFVVPYSPEYSVSGVNWQRLQQIAAAGGGQVLTAPAQAFADNLAPVRGRVELWRWLLILAALLWPVDVAVRRLVLHTAALRGWLRALRVRARREGRALQTAALRRQALRREARRELARAEALASPGVASAAAAPWHPQPEPDQGQPGPAPVVRPPATPPGQGAAQPGSEPEGPPPPPASAPGSHAARLLAAKRRRQEQQQSEAG